MMISWGLNKRMMSGICKSVEIVRFFKLYSIISYCLRLVLQGFTLALALALLSIDIVIGIGIGLTFTNLFVRHNLVLVPECVHFQAETRLIHNYLQ